MFNHIIYRAAIYFATDSQLALGLDFYMTILTYNYALRNYVVLTHGLV